MHNKSQSATEFIVLVSFMVLVILGFFAVTSSNLLEAKEEGNKRIARDIAEFAYREIEIAKSVNNGYSRIFAVPRSINNVNYTIQMIDDRELVVNYLGNEFIKFLPQNVTGNISKGLNLIRKEEDIVYINKVLAQCENNIDDDGDGLADTSDPGCYTNCDYLNPANYIQDWAEPDVCTCAEVTSAECCLVATGNHYSLFDSSCSSGKCQTGCLGPPIFAVKNNLFKVGYFLDDGNVILKGTLQQNTNPLQTSDDEFVFQNNNNENVAVVNLVTGNMIIKGSLQQNQSSLNPPAASNDFIVKDSNNIVVSYIDESGNLLIKGILMENASSILG